ncbi:MAG: Fe-S cluster assembly protein SufD [Bacteroides sp.]|nr:Fe-S cluster assembly protein SufD [Bacteroides sp.]MCM1413935.1 Fe-S cluster assembly protein SufD [Bacteroides sp.]MCM1471638.1 Fe-S cluster assembly protein SufD [Bacteroides sp.]
MNSLSQYLELYRLNRQAIDAGSAPVLNRLRQEAFEMLANARLAERGDEDFERTSLNDMFAADYGVNVNRVNFTADPAASFRCDVPNMSTLLGVVVNDEFHPTRTLLGSLPEGVRFMSLRRAAEEFPELVGSQYATLAPLTDPAVALNTMLVQDGVLIHVAKGVKVDKPLQLVNIFNAPTSLLAPRRVLIVMDDNSEARLLVCDHTQDLANPYLASEVVEVILGSNARFDYCNIEESSANTSRHSHIYCRQQQGSSFTAGSVTLTCGTTRNDFSIDLCGQDAECRLSGMVIGSDSQHIDNSVVLRHLVPHCRSNQLFKYVLDGNSTGAFGGRILVAPDARFTDAMQTDRNLLASTGARMHSKPQLEIYNDDVKCSHGATTGQLDAEALFYMRTRGIPEAEARTMLMQAFMSDVIDSIAMEELRDRLRHLVEKRFNGSAAGCADCSATCPKL